MAWQSVVLRARSMTALPELVRWKRHRRQRMDSATSGFAERADDPRVHARRSRRDDYALPKRGFSAATERVFGVPVSVSAATHRRQRLAFLHGSIEFGVRAIAPRGDLASGPLAAEVT